MDREPPQIAVFDFEAIQASQRATAYVKVVQSAEIYAERKGLFVIRATGNSSSIINRDSFLPKAFH